MALDPLVGFVLTALVAVIVLYFAFKLGKKVIVLLINSFLGLIVLVLINFVPQISIDITIWNVLIVALGGIPGIALVVILDVLELSV